MLRNSPFWCDWFSGSYTRDTADKEVIFEVVENSKVNDDKETFVDETRQIKTLRRMLDIVVLLKTGMHHFTCSRKPLHCVNCFFKAPLRETFSISLDGFMLNFGQVVV